MTSTCLLGDARMYLQHEAAKVQESITSLLAKKAALASIMEAQAQLLASPELLQNHPELHWEKVSDSNMPRLGIAKELLVRDRRLTDFKWAASPCMLNDQRLGHIECTSHAQC